MGEKMGQKGYFHCTLGKNIIHGNAFWLLHGKLSKAMLAPTLGLVVFIQHGVFISWEKTEVQQSLPVSRPREGPLPFW